MAYTGRREIFTDEYSVTRENVLAVLGQAAISHEANKTEIDYLYNYYKGIHPVLYRTKEYNDFVNNKIVENRAYEIVNFKKGFLVGEPIQYVSMDDSGEASKDVADLNRMMVLSDMAAKNVELVEWQLICGQGYKIVLPSEGEIPFNVYIPDPRQTFIVKRNDVAKTPLMGVYFVNSTTGIKTFQCWTEDSIYEIKAGAIISERPNMLGFIPIVEFPTNNARIGAFECVLGLLDAIDEIDSDRLDGLDQFIQSLLVLTNVDLEDDITAKTIRESGMIVIPSQEGREAKVAILSQELNQQQTQVLKEDMYKAVLEIVGMPSQGDGNTGDSSNNGAVVLKNGWQSAEASAKAHEMMFSKSERETLKIVLYIVNTLGNRDIKLRDIAIKFTRRNYENLLAKAQVLTMMLASDKIAPKLAFEQCGIFADAETAARESAEYEKSNKPVAKEDTGGEDEN